MRTNFAILAVLFGLCTAVPACAQTTTANTQANSAEAGGNPGAIGSSPASISANAPTKDVPAAKSGDVGYSAIAGAGGR